MRKLNIFYLISILLIYLINSKQLIPVQAEYDPISNTLIYNGKIFEYSDIKNTIDQDKMEIQESLSFHGESEGEKKSFFDGFWFNFIGFSILACFAGAMSGLTVGYLSIDMLILEIKLDSGTEQEKIYANKIKKVINDHHWILVTLLLCNAFACEAMPILLDKLVNEVMAIVISVTVLLFVGEIVPQALCTGPNQMKIAAFLAPFTYSLMIITYPLSYPIAKFMDCVVGLHGKTRFCNSDLKSVIELHVKEYKGNLNAQQMGYFTGFLDVMNKKVGELMLPIEKAFKLDYKYKIDKVNVEKLINSGYSRIPIYENDPNNLIGILRLKDLVGIDLLNPSILSELDIKLNDAVHASENTSFLDLFEKFKDGKSRMAFVHKELKDEKLLPDNEIEDEKENHLVKEEKQEKQEKQEEKQEKQEEKHEKEKIDEPLLINNHEENKIIEDGDKKKEKKKIIKENNDFENSPIIGIITLEDLIESWLKIHILDEENYDKNEKVRARSKTIH